VGLHLYSVENARHKVMEQRAVLSAKRCNAVTQYETRATRRSKLLSSRTLIGFNLLMKVNPSEYEMNREF
jgi:hypothetical protein